MQCQMQSNKLDSSHFLLSYSFDNQGKSRKIDQNDIAKNLMDEDLSWIHLDGNSEDSKLWLEDNVSYLDHLIIDALFAEETRPRIVEFEDGMLIILRAINLNKNEEIEDMVSLRMWVDQKRIVSIQRRRFLPVFNLAHKIDQSITKIKSSSQLLYNIIYEINSATAPSIINLNDKLDLIEDNLNSIANSDMRETVSLIRKQVAVFKRYLIPQKEVILRLKNNEYKWIDDWAIRHFQENHDQITNVIEEIDEAKERAQIIHYEISNIIADKLNKIMFKISLTASIFLPLSFVVGLFGMNVGGVPLENNNNGFFIVTYFAIMIVTIFYFLLKNKKLF